MLRVSMELGCLNTMSRPERSRIIWAVRGFIRVIPALIGELQGVSLQKACFSVDNLLYYICHTHRASMRQRIAYFGEFFLFVGL